MEVVVGVGDYVGQMTPIISIFSGIRVPYWQEIHKDIDNVFRADIYYHVVQDTRVSSQLKGGISMIFKKKWYVQILLAASKKAVTRKWIKSEMHPPLINE